MLQKDYYTILRASRGCRGLLLAREDFISLLMVTDVVDYPLYNTTLHPTHQFAHLYPQYR